MIYETNNRQMLNLIKKEFEKLREELPLKKSATKNYTKVKKADKK